MPRPLAPLLALTLTVLLGALPASAATDDALTEPGFAPAEPELAAIPTTRAPGYEYVHPLPDARLVSAFNNILLRPGHRLVEAALRSYKVSVVGSTSGNHPGRLVLSDDSRTAIFEPDDPFAPGEEVTVTVGRFPLAGRDEGDAGPGSIVDAAAADLDQHGLRNLSFRFTVSPWTTTVAAPFVSEASELRELEPQAESDPLASFTPPPHLDDSEASLDLNQLPARYPTPTLLASNHPAPGRLFIAPFSSQVIDPGHLLILDEYARPIFYRQLLRPATDFKLQPDGRLSYFTRETSSNPIPQFYLLDETAAVVDSIEAGNGYATDSHELRFLPNGHALLMAYDPQPVRMDLVVPGGRGGATVVGLVIQELDAARRVVFQWRSWDHFEITETASALATLTGPTVDYVHGNAIEIDRDGDLLVSSRHMNEITKISRRTGEVVWRMGPNARRNEFDFLGDPRGFSHQHDIRVLPNGHYTLYDNGNFVMPQISRALEFEIDEAGRTARLAWEYRRTPPVYGPFMGGVQRLDDGGTLVGWGGVTGSPKVTEIHADGTTAFEIALPRSNIWSYRAHRAPWRTRRLLVNRTSIEFDPGGSPMQEVPVVVTNPGTEPITLNYFTVAGSNDYSIPWNTETPLAAGRSVEIPIRFLAGPGADIDGKAYIGAVTSTDVIVQDITLSGSSAADRAPAPARFEARDARTGIEAGLELSVSPAGIRYSLPGNGRAKLEVFDLRGARVRVLVDQDVTSGVHSTEWPSSLSEGLYFVRLSAASGRRVRKFAQVR